MLWKVGEESERLSVYLDVVWERKSEGNPLTQHTIPFHNDEKSSVPAAAAVAFLSDFF